MLLRHSFSLTETLADDPKSPNAVVLKRLEAARNSPLSQCGLYIVAKTALRLIKSGPSYSVDPK
jgi:hypothetical protein